MSNQKDTANNNNLIETYIDEINFLLNLKKSITVLNNRIHDKLVLIAIERLKKEFNDLNFSFSKATASGIDIKGLDAKGELKLIAEVKTTTSGKTLKGPQKNSIEKDLIRLKETPGDLQRNLIVLSKITKEAVIRQLNTDQDFPDIKIINALDNLDENLIIDEEEI